METKFYWFCPKCDAVKVKKLSYVSQELIETEKSEFLPHFVCDLKEAQTQLEIHEKISHNGKSVGYFGLKNI